MMCDKCGKTQDKLEISAYVKDGKYEFFCDRCNPNRPIGQKALE